MQSKDIVAAELTSHGTQRPHYVALLLWMFLGFLFVSLFSQWFTTNSRDAAFTEYIDHVIRVAANEHRSAKDVRALILIKAGDLSLPVQGDGIQINGNGQTLRAAVKYETDIRMPIVNQPVYRMRFQHDRALGPIQQE
jgi:hypothetical protein